MQLRLRTKLTLIMTGLVLLVVAVLSAVFVAQLFEQVLQQTDKRTLEIANQVFEQAKRALAEAAERGLRSASNDAADINDYVEKAFRMSEGLNAQLKAAKLDTPSIYEVSITNKEGRVLISTDESLRGKSLARRTNISQLTRRGYLHQARVLGGPPQVYELDFPFNNGDQPFGEVRVVVSSGLLLNEISGNVRKFGTIVLLALVISTLVAAVVSRATLAPLSDISAQLDRISAGQYDGRAGGRPAALHPRCARRDGQPCGGEISRRARRALFGSARERNFPARASFARSPARAGRRTARDRRRNGPGHRRWNPTSWRECAGDSGRRRAHGRAGDPARPRLHRKHQHTVASQRAARGAGAHHRGRGARSEESAELHAPVAGKSQGIVAAGARQRQRFLEIFQPQ